MERWIFLSGMMGSGKSTVARALAAHLGVTDHDLDARVVARAGQSIEAIFREHGEPRFRELETEEVERLVATEKPGVVALGGGTVTHTPTRRALLRRGTLITLTAPAAELARRVAEEKGRPLLAQGEAVAVLTALLEERRAAYAECHASVASDRPLAEVVREVASVAACNAVAVPLGERTYRVDIGTGLIARLGERLPGRATLVVTDRNVEEPWARAASECLGAERVVLTPGEEHKTIAAVEAIWDRALDAGLDRNAALLAVGGGVVGDLTGFAASTLLRGIDFAQVPTSLLAMVDASVGGKTGFDRRQGKNLVGTFHQPRFVLCDLDTLSTLPDEELRSGLAEVVKSAWLEGEAAVAALERDAKALRARDRAALARAITRSVALKADVVAGDERESGRRMILNLGHTVGHAIEADQNYRIRHGEAVALGMVAAFRVARALGDTKAAAHERRLVALLTALGLPTDLRAHLRDGTLAYVGADKKRAAGKVRFIVPGAPGAIEVVPIDVATIAAALAG